MAEEDQDMREKNFKDPDFWDAEIDRKNTEEMKEIISQIGWPTVSKVGKEASFNAWLLVQHSDYDADFQRHCLDLMKKEKVLDVNQKNIALLEDRVLLKETGFQKYGTQFKQEEGFFVPLPIMYPENVEERRKEMGLDSLQENLSRMYEKYGENKSK